MVRSLSFLFDTYSYCEGRFGRSKGKNSMYHLLNKNIGKYVKVLLNKNWVKETVNPVLPSQTPTSFPSVLGDISLFLYQKEKSYLAKRLYFQRNDTSEK